MFADKMQKVLTVPTAQPGQECDWKSVKGVAWPPASLKRSTRSYISICGGALLLWQNGWTQRSRGQSEQRFFCFDVVDFCPSISENLLKRPLQLEFAEQYTAIDVILHSLESMLFNQDRDWIKKGAGLFVMAMGCYDGAAAEICQLVAIGTLSL